MRIPAKGEFVMRFRVFARTHLHRAEIRYDTPVDRDVFSFLVLKTCTVLDSCIDRVCIDRARQSF